MLRPSDIQPNVDNIVENILQAIGTSLA